MNYSGTKQQALEEFGLQKLHRCTSYDECSVQDKKNNNPQVIFPSLVLA